MISAVEGQEEWYEVLTALCYPYPVPDWSQVEDFFEEGISPEETVAQWANYCEAIYSFQSKIAPQ